MSLKLYFDLMSQPCRSVLLFLKINKIPFEEMQISLKQGENLTPQFNEVSKFQKVPVLQDEDYTLTQSAAILVYLHRKLGLDEHWYPTNDLKKHSRVNEYLFWHAHNTRLHCSMYFHQRIRRHPLDFQKLKKWKDLCEHTLTHIEGDWLREGREKYIAGDRISIADLLAVCELFQPYVAGWDVGQGHPLLQEYMERVQADTAPYFFDVHSEAIKVRNILQQQGKIN